MFEKKWNLLLGLVFGFVIFLSVKLLFETPDRPFTVIQSVLLYIGSALPGIGFAMLIDPAPRRLKKELLKENFYENPQASNKFFVKRGGKCK